MKNKILSISIIFILLSFIFINNSVFATVTSGYTFYNIEQEVIDYVYSLPEYTDDCCVIIAKDSGGYQVRIISKYGSLYVDSNRYGRINLASTDEMIFNFYQLNFDGSNVSISSGPTQLTRSSFELYLNAWDYNIFSNVDIYTDSTCTDFFYKAPIVEPVQETLATVLAQNSPIQIFSSLIQNVLVSLTVFLVGLVAFSKAWVWLKTQLRKA